MRLVRWSGNAEGAYSALPDTLAAFGEGLQTDGEREMTGGRKGEKEKGERKSERRGGKEEGLRPSNIKIISTP